MNDRIKTPRGTFPVRFDVGDTLRYFRLGKAAPRVLPEFRPPDSVPFTW